jgi:hypothetical protein
VKRPSDRAPAGRVSTDTIILVVILALVASALTALGALVRFSALSAARARRYVGEARASEGKVAVMVLARGVAACASLERVDERGGVAAGLPPTSKPVPASLAEIAAKPYVSSPSDWGEQAFACAHFSLEAPQSFQYQWVALGPRAGVARASADLDGDGKPDHRFEIDVTCGAGGECRAGALRELH